ncbi:MAG TPA: DUF11 domain-containing protein, partial [Candidatus Wirthbacteria bacterium]|nr:DUF11 domain-containing protein [Candidatus Wirthbacteria bacterium]
MGENETITLPYAHNTGNHTVRWPAANEVIPTLPAGATGTASVTVRVSNDAQSGDQVINRVRIAGATSPRDLNPGNNEDTDTNRLARAEFDITKTLAKSSILAGERAEYTIIVTNVGDATGTARVTDEMDFSIFSKLYLNGPEIGIPADGVLVLDEALILASQDSKTYRLSGVSQSQWPEAGSFPFGNIAKVTWGDDSAEATAVLNITAAPEIALGKQAFNLTKGGIFTPTVDLGDRIEYRLTATNSGSASVAWTFEDDLSDVVDDLRAGGIIGDDINCQISYASCIWSNPYTLQADNPVVINPGETREFVFVVDVDYTANGNQRLYNVYGNAIDIYVRSPQLRVTKTSSVEGSSVYPGAIVWFYIDIENIGNQRVNQIELVDWVDSASEDVIFQYAWETRGITRAHPYTAGEPISDPTTARVLHWPNLPGLNPGEGYQLSFKARVMAYPTVENGSSYENRTRAYYPQFDQNPSNQAATLVHVLPMPEVQMEIEKTAFPSLVKAAGNPVEFTITVSNQSRERQAKMFVKDILPEGFLPVFTNYGSGREILTTVQTYENGQMKSNNAAYIPDHSYDETSDTYTYIWTRDNTGFTIPAKIGNNPGRLVIKFSAYTPGTPLDEARVYTNNAWFYQGAKNGLELGWDYANVTVPRVARAAVQVDKMVSLGDINVDGMNFVKEATIDSFQTRYVTYRIAAYNLGDKSMNVRLTDSVDFISTNRVYDELRVYDQNLVPGAVYTAANAGSSIILNDNLLVPAGSGAYDNICAGCLYYVVARVRTDFVTGQEVHVNTARASQLPAAGGQMVDEDTSTVRANLAPAQIVVTKQVRIPGGQWQDISVANVDPDIDSSIEYRIVVRNVGDLRSSALDIYDKSNANTAPIYTQVRDLTNSQNYPDSVYSILLAGNIHLAGGESKEFELEGKIASTFDRVNPQHCNTAYAYRSGTTREIATDDACVEIATTQSLSVQKQVRQVGSANFQNAITVRPGAVVEYLITVRNTGNAAQNVFVTDDLDGVSLYHSSVYMANRNYDGNANSFTGNWDSASTKVAAAEVEQYTFRAVVKSPFPETGVVIHNVAQANGVDSNQTAVTVDVTQRPGIAKLVSLDGVNYHQTLTAKPGQTLYYKVLVWNAETGYMPTLVIEDILDPADYSAYGHNLNRDADNNGRAFVGINYDHLSIQVPGGTGQYNRAESFTFEAILKDSGFTTGDQVINTARTSYANQDYEASTSVNIHVPAPLIRRSKTAYNQTQQANAETRTAAPGDVIIYRITATNQGDAPRTNFIMTDDISDVLNYGLLQQPIVNGGTLSGDCSDPGPYNCTITWPAIASLNPQQSVTREFKVVVKDPLPQQGDYIMRNTYGNTVQVPVGDLALNKSVSFTDGSEVDRAIRNGESIRFTISATNNGGRDINNFVFRDNIVDLLEYAQITTISHSGNQDGNFLIWPATSLPAGQTVSRTFTARIRPVSQWPKAGDFMITNVYGDSVEVEVFHSQIT